MALVTGRRGLALSGVLLLVLAVGGGGALAGWRASEREAAPLRDVRRELCARHGLDLVAVPDPPRDREPDDYPGAVSDWHEARVAAYAAVLRERGGTAAFLVWGDPSLYDSTIRIVRRLAELLPLEWDVLPGISAPQLLAARHRIVLHEVGEPVHVTTGRRLRRAIESGQRNLVVMLNAGLDLAGLRANGAEPPLGQTITRQTFLAQTKGLHAWSVTQGCRFYARIIDGTSAGNKSGYIQARRAVEDRFYPLVAAAAATPAPTP